MTLPTPRPDWYANPSAREWRCDPPPAAAVAAFHRGLPGYARTPLVELPALAAELGVGRVLVKDESSRLGLPAFKVLGASWAVARLVADRAGLAGPLTLDRLRSAAGPPGRVPSAVVDPGAGPRRRRSAGHALTLVTATDGNHGRAVARMARLLGVPARVLVPEVVPARAAELIAGEGAIVTTVAGPYDETVAEAARVAAADPDAELVQDTAWPGYESVPARIVEGYATLLAEIDPVPDLVVVPIGVGSLAQAVVTHYRSGGPAPAVLGVEPDTAACVLASLHAGRPRSVPTGTTVMAGLNCGTPSSLAWPVLRAGLDAAVAVTDAEATWAVADLAVAGLSSGPSGAATLAAARAALGRPDRRAALGIGPDATVVLLSTEGGG